MLWEELEPDEEEEQESPIDFDFLSLLSKPKDYYKILEVDYDATEETIRSNYIRLALKWHPDKKKDEESATSRFQEINEAYQVLIDPVKRQDYDRKGILHILDYNATRQTVKESFARTLLEKFGFFVFFFVADMDYLNRYKGLILTCNGLGIRYSIW